MSNVGIPIKLLFEAEGMKVTVEVSAHLIVYFFCLSSNRLRIIYCISKPIYAGLLPKSVVIGLSLSFRRASLMLFFLPIQ